MAGFCSAKCKANIGGGGGRALQGAAEDAVDFGSSHDWAIQLFGHRNGNFITAM